MARFSQLSVAAAGMALADAELDVGTKTPERIGVRSATATAACRTPTSMHTVIEKGGNRLAPFFMSKMLPNIAAAQVAMQFGLKGTTTPSAPRPAPPAPRRWATPPTSSASAAPTSWSPAAGRPASASSGSPASTSCTRSPPQRRPEARLAALRQGPRRLRLRRGRRHLHLRVAGARPAARRPHLGELAGYGATLDAYHVVAPCVDGEGAQRAIRLALADAGISPRTRSTTSTPTAPRRRPTTPPRPPRSSASSASAPTRSPSAPRSR